MWEVVRATTAAPTYLAPMRLRDGDEAAEYVDGGFGTNNPSLEGYHSAREASGRNLSLILSIGAGAVQNHTTTSVTSLARDLVSTNDPGRWDLIAANVDLKMMDLKTSGGLDDYCRLNVEEGLSDMALDEWKGRHGKKTLRLIRERTEEYLRLPRVKDDIAKAARTLVETRRARASTDHWERFCNGVEYVCTVTNCSDSGNVHRERGDLRRHLEDVHHIDPSTIIAVLNRGRRYRL